MAGSYIKSGTTATPNNGSQRSEKRSFGVTGCNQAKHSTAQGATHSAQSTGGKAQHSTQHRGQSVAKAFTPGRADGGFKLWAGKGIKQLKDVFGKNKTLLSFEELMATFYIPRTHLLNFFQLRDFIKVKQAQSLTIPPLSIIERALIRNPFERGIISGFYTLLVDFSPETSESRFNAWNSDLQGELIMDEFNTACEEAQAQTSNTRLKLLQYNWLMRVYIRQKK